MGSNKTNDKKNSAKKTQKSGKKTQKTNKKNGKISGKNNKSTKKLNKSNSKVVKASGKNTKKQGKKSTTKKTDKASGKANGKILKTGGNKAAKNAKKSTPKGQQKADNLVFLWLLWGILTIFIVGGFYWVFVYLSLPQKPNIVTENNQTLVFDNKGTKLIGYAPYNVPAKPAGALAPMKNEIVPSAEAAKEKVVEVCQTRSCYEQANIFLLPPNIK